MLKLFNIFLLIFLFIFKSNSFSSEISELLKKQQLTVFDIGIFRLKEDLLKAHKEIYKHLDTSEENLYLDVITSYKSDQIILIASIPMDENLNSLTYMSDSFRCRNIFNSIRDHLLKQEIYNDYRYSMAKSYLTSVFSTPSSWRSWRYNEKFSEDLVNLVKLQVTLRPTNKLALKETVYPVSCEGGLEYEKEELILTKKYN